MMATDNTAVDRIYCGDMTNLTRPIAPVIRLMITMILFGIHLFFVRLYVASTYTDMVLEKTELANHIYPVIKEYCKQVQNSTKHFSYS